MKLERHENPWEELALYESRDYVSAEYKRWHDAELSAKKAVSIISNIRQGADFFKSAKLASNLVRPLLIYYGVLALSRGLILCLTSKLESGLTPSHGLEIEDFALDESTDRVNINLPAMSCSLLHHGAFPELIQAIRNKSRLVINPAPFPSNPIKASYMYAITIEGQVTFNDVLSRLPFLRDDYTKLTQRQPDNYKSFVFCLDNQTDIDMFVYSGMPTEEVVRRLWKIDAAEPVTLANQHTFFGAQPYYLVRKNVGPANLQPPMLVEGFSDEAQGMLNFVIEPLSGIGDIAQLGLMFIAAYFCGMIVRYRPSSWYSLNSQKRGDQYMPLFNSVCNLVESEFPRLMAAELQFAPD